MSGDFYIDVRRSELARALRELRAAIGQKRFDKRHAWLRYSTGTFVIEIDRGQATLPADGTWPATVQVTCRMLRLLGLKLPTGATLTLRYKEGRFVITAGQVRWNCAAELNEPPREFHATKGMYLRPVKTGRTRRPAARPSVAGNALPDQAGTAGRDGLRALAMSALMQQVAQHWELHGPYKWGAPGSPRVNILRPGNLPPAEQLIFFLAVQTQPLGLGSSTVILLNEVGPSVVFIGSAHDEG